MKKIILLPLFILICSCASLKSGVDSFAKPVSNKGYIIGSFLNSYRESTAGLAIEIGCSSEKSPIYIKMNLPRNHEGLEIFPVNPGECRVKSLVRLGTAGDIMKKSDLVTENMEDSFEVKPGILSYIGSFDGKSTHSLESFGLVGGVGWVSTSGTESVEVTSKDIQEIRKEISDRYPAFSKMKLVDTLSLNEEMQRTSR